MNLKYILVFVLLLFSCTHDKQIAIIPSQPTSSDSVLLPFTFIPMDSVKWIVHCQGTMIGDSTGYHWDSSLHYYTTVAPTGQQAHLLGGNSFEFRTITTTINNPYGMLCDTALLYIREDTVNKMIYSLYHYKNGWSATWVIDYNLNISDTVSEFFRWPVCRISTIDSIVVKGIFFKKWNCTTASNKKYFYLAYGIGGQMGILPDDGFLYSGNGGEVRSMDFIYKSDSLHFDFDYY